MEDQVPSHVLKDLTALGEANDAQRADSSILARLAGFDWVNRVSCNAWTAAVSGLTGSDLERLTRGLVIAEEQINWVGGSVSGAIWVFHALQAKDQSACEDLADWCLRYSTNPYIPFGSYRGGCRSLEGYGEFVENRSRRRNRAQQERALAEEHRAMREWLRVREHRRTLTIQKADSEARSTLMTEMALLDPVHRLRLIALDDLHPPDYYPPEFFSTDASFLSGLKPQELDALLTKYASQRWWKRWQREAEKFRASIADKGQQPRSQ
jgi:hypothetical protein